MEYIATKAQMLGAIDAWAQRAGPKPTVMRAVLAMQRNVQDRSLGRALRGKRVAHGLAQPPGSLTAAEIAEALGADFRDVEDVIRLEAADLELSSAADRRRPDSEGRVTYDTQVKFRVSGAEAAKLARKIESDGYASRSRWFRDLLADVLDDQMHVTRESGALNITAEEDVMHSAALWAASRGETLEEALAAQIRLWGKAHRATLIAVQK